MAIFTVQGSKCKIWDEYNGYWARALISCERDEVNNKFTISVLGMQNRSYGGGNYGVTYTCKLSSETNVVSSSVKVITEGTSTRYYPKSGIRYNDTYFKAVDKCSITVDGTSEGKCPDVNLYFYGSQKVYYRSGGYYMTIKSKYNASIRDMCRENVGQNDLTPPNFLLYTVTPETNWDATYEVQVDTGSDKNTFDLWVENTSKGSSSYQQENNHNSIVLGNISTLEGYNNIKITAIKNNNNKSAEVNLVLDANTPTITKFDVEPISNTEAAVSISCAYPHIFNRAVINDSLYTCTPPYSNSYRFIISNLENIQQTITGKIFRSIGNISSNLMYAPLDMRLPVIDDNMSLNVRAKSGVITFTPTLPSNTIDTYSAKAQWIDGNGVLLNTKDITLNNGVVEWEVDLAQGDAANVSQSYTLRVARIINNGECILYTDKEIRNTESCTSQIETVSVHDNTILVRLKVDKPVYVESGKHVIEAWLSKDTNEYEGILQSFEQDNNVYEFKFDNLPRNVSFILNVKTQNANSQVTSSQVIRDERLKCLTPVYLCQEGRWKDGILYIFDGKQYRTAAIYVVVSEDGKKMWKYCAPEAGENN